MLLGLSAFPTGFAVKLMLTDKSFVNFVKHDWSKNPSLGNTFYVIIKFEMCDWSLFLTNVKFKNYVQV